LRVVIFDELFKAQTTKAIKSQVVC
jgi:hypothetical protein